MSHRTAALLGVMAVAVITTVYALAGGDNPVISTLLALPMVLALPGYAVVTALFPRRVMGRVEQVVLSLGLSLAIAVLGGFALNWTSSGLRSSSWAMLLSGITIGGCIVGLARQHGHLMPDIEGLRTEHLGVGLTWRQVLLGGLAMVIVGGALTLSTMGAAQQQRAQRFTQLWILPASGAQAKSAVHIGIRNMEQATVTYSLDLTVDGKVATVWPAIPLRPDEQWEATFALPASDQTAARRVEAVLYRADMPHAVYRHVVLSLGP